MSNINLESSCSTQINIHEVNFIDNSGNIIMKLNNVKNVSMTINNRDWYPNYIRCSIDANGLDYFIKSESKVEEVYVDMMECKYREI